MTEPTRYGATPHDWTWWSETLGLMTELLPTVCTPHATISPTSVLTNYHKVPCRYTTIGLVVGMPKWNALHSRAADIRDWSAEQDYGICLQMRTIQAFDVDITNAAIVAKITDTLGLYEMPRRWRENSSKCLFLFHPATPSKKRVLKVGDGMIEMLGLGNQCLVAGHHPSGVRYQWDPFTRIPVLDDETVAWLLEDLRKDFGGTGAWSRGARVPTNVADPGGEARRKMERMAAKAAHAAAEEATRLATAGILTSPTPTQMLDELAVYGTVSVFVPNETTLVMGETPIVAEPAHSDEQAAAIGQAFTAGFAKIEAKLAALDAEIARDEAYAALGPDPVIAYLTEKGVVKGEGSDGLLYVTCPFEVAHGKSNADMTQTVYFPAGTGGYLMGHVKCLDGVCGDKTDRDFLDAWGWTLADGLRGFVEEPVPAAPQEALAVLRSLGVLTPVEDPTAHPLDAPNYDRVVRTGEIKVHQNNLTLFCRHPLECGYVFTKDTFTNKVYALKVEAGAVPLEMVDEVLTDLVMRARDRGFGPTTAPRDQLQYALLYTATPYDSAIQWLRSLPAWDGVPRVGSFCHRYLGCEDTSYHTAVSQYWWTALAGRLVSLEGIQADMVPILIGVQGSGKSSTARAMVPYPEWYASLSFHTSPQEQTLKMFGKLVGELAELSGLRGKDMESTKEWLTTQKDTARIVYERFPRSYTRRLVFVGTTNRDDFATDDTGNRRLLPIRVGAAQDIPAIVRDRDQLWAEAAGLFEAGGIQWRDADRLGRDEHASIMVQEPMEVRIATWLTTSQTLLVAKDGIEGLTWGELPYLTTVDIAIGALHATPIQAIAPQVTFPIGRVMARFGYTKHHIRVDGHQCRVWTRPGIRSAEIADWKAQHCAKRVN